MPLQTFRSEKKMRSKGTNIFFMKNEKTPNFG